MNIYRIIVLLMGIMVLLLGIVLMLSPPIDKLDKHNRTIRYYGMGAIILGLAAIIRCLI